jgi:hypothetical protein
MATPAELYKKFHEEFIAERTKQEMAVLQFAESVRDIGREAFEGIDIPEELTLQNLVPELYSDDPMQEIYEQQVKDANALLASINNVVSKINAESRRELMDYLGVTDESVSSAELQKIYREKFIKIRTKYEMAISNFAEGIKKVDLSQLEGKIEFPEDMSLKTFIPELYKDIPDKDIYLKQYNRTNEFFSNVNRVIKQINEEACKCLSEYKVQASSK